MKKEIVIDMSEIETRAALLEEGKVVEFFFDRATQSRLVGNIFKGVVENVLPGIQSAFVNIGLDKNAFLLLAICFWMIKIKRRRLKSWYALAKK